MRIHWWIKYANYVVTLGVNVQKNIAFSNGEIGKDLEDAWRASLSFSPTRLMDSIMHERSCKIFCLNYFKPAIKTEYSTSQTQFAQWVQKRTI